MLLYVICSRERWEVEVNPSDTIATLKPKVQELTGIPADRQRLRTGGDQLDDGLLISESMTKCWGPCAVEVNGSMDLYVQTMSGKKISLCVSDIDDNIEHVKGQIQALQGIPPKRQRYFFNGKEIQNTGTLFDNNIPEKSTVHLKVCSCGIFDS